MNDTSAKQRPFGGYEYVTVTFPVADQDVVVPYSRLRTDDRNNVRWLDVSAKSGRVYQPSVNTVGFGQSHIVLRCDVAGTTTRILLFVERTEANG